jgi:hypothetical protein
VIQSLLQADSNSQDIADTVRTHATSVKASTSSGGGKQTNRHSTVAVGMATAVVVEADSAEASFDSQDSPCFVSKKHRNKRSFLTQPDLSQKQMSQATTVFHYGGSVSPSTKPSLKPSQSFRGRGLSIVVEDSVYDSTSGNSFNSAVSDFPV